jgi:hypothetical protein
MATTYFNHYTGYYDHGVPLERRGKPSRSELYPLFHYEISYTTEAGEHCYTGVYDAFSINEAILNAKFKLSYCKQHGRSFTIVIVQRWI